MEESKGFRISMVAVKPSHELLMWKGCKDIKKAKIYCSSKQQAVKSRNNEKKIFKKKERKKLQI